MYVDDVIKLCFILLLGSVLLLLDSFIHFDVFFLEEKERGSQSTKTIIFVRNLVIFLHADHWREDSWTRLLISLGISSFSWT